MAGAAEWLQKDFVAVPGISLQPLTAGRARMVPKQAPGHRRPGAEGMEETLEAPKIPKLAAQEPTAGFVQAGRAGQELSQGRARSSLTLPQSLRLD